MRVVAVKMFRCSLRLLPPKLRRQYADEMADVFAQRIHGRSVGFAVLHTVDEMLDVALVSVRARMARYRVPRPTLAAAVVMAVLLVIRGSSDLPSSAEIASSQSGRIDFSAHDPAGQFTLTILNGHPIAATMNRIPLPLQQVVHEGDSIRIMGPGGNVALSLAYYRESGRIEWTARPAACRSISSGCEASR